MFRSISYRATINRFPQKQLQRPNRSLHTSTTTPKSLSTNSVKFDPINILRYSLVGVLFYRLFSFSRSDVDNRTTLTHCYNLPYTTTHSERQQHVPSIIPKFIRSKLIKNEPLQQIAEYYGLTNDSTLNTPYNAILLNLNDYDKNVLKSRVLNDFSHDHTQFNFYYSPNQKTKPHSIQTSEISNKQHSEHNIVDHIKKTQRFVLHDMIIITHKLHYLKTVLFPILKKEVQIYTTGGVEFENDIVSIISSLYKKYIPTIIAKLYDFPSRNDNDEVSGQDKKGEPLKQKGRYAINNHLDLVKNHIEAITDPLKMSHYNDMVLLLQNNSHLPSDLKDITNIKKNEAHVNNIMNKYFQCDPDIINTVKVHSIVQNQIQYVLNYIALLHSANTVGKVAGTNHSNLFKNISNKIAHHNIIMELNKLAAVSDDEEDFAQIDTIFVRNQVLLPPSVNCIGEISDITIVRPAIPPSDPNTTTPALNILTYLNSITDINNQQQHSITSQPYEESLSTPMNFCEVNNDTLISTTLFEHLRDNDEYCVDIHALTQIVNNSNTLSVFGLNSSKLATLTRKIDADTKKTHLSTTIVPIYQALPIAKSSTANVRQSDV